MPKGVYDRSHVHYWQTGKTKATDERLRKIGEKFMASDLSQPFVCFYCSLEISKLGINSESLVFHSLDGNHQNWDPLNKVPVHRKCHPKQHKKERLFPEGLL